QGGRLDFPATLVVNGGPTETRLKVDFTDSTPTFETTVKATNITIDQDVELLGYFIPLMILPKDGTVKTTLGLDLAAEGTDFDWPTLRKNLAVTGTLKLNQGSVSGGEVVSGVLRLLGESDTFKFDGMTSAFALSEGRIKSESIEINSQSLDFALSGWTSIIPDPETGGYAMHYEAGNELLKKYAGKELAQYSALLGTELDSFSPLLITGTIQKPKVKLNLPTITRAAKGILGNALQEGLLDKLLDGKGKDKIDTKGLEDAGRNLLKGLLKGEQGADDKPNRAPDVKKLEDVGRDLLKGLFGND
ncbi:MAG: hypothetical protein KAI66_15485, partial [Lentisphaeria bacterium]|nr:hypothetical protein [Lentisphaeria bacterium]